MSGEGRLNRVHNGSGTHFYIRYEPNTIISYLCFFSSTFRWAYFGSVVTFTYAFLQHASYFSELTPELIIIDLISGRTELYRSVTLNLCAAGARLVVGVAIVIALIFALLCRDRTRNSFRVYRPEVHVMINSLDFSSTPASTNI